MRRSSDYVPLSARQPWGIFFVKFEPEELPVVGASEDFKPGGPEEARHLLRRLIDPPGQADDLLFVSNYGEGDERHITFAHFSIGAKVPNCRR